MSAVRVAFTCGLVLAGCSIGDELSSTTEELAAFSSNIATLSPSGWWRMDDFPSTTIVDHSGNGLNGSYGGNYVIDSTSGVVGDSDHATTFTGIDESWGWVPDNDRLSMTQVYDNFAQTQTSYSTSWGTTDDGKVWTCGTCGNYFIVNGGRARVVPRVNGTGAFQANMNFDQAQSNVALAEGNVEVNVTWTTTPTTDMPVASLIVQQSSSTNYVYVQMIENTSHQVSLQIVRVINGARTVLATGNANLVHSFSDTIWLRVQFTAGSYKARAWPDGLAEPMNWQAAYSPPPPPRYGWAMAPGQVIVRASTIGASASAGGQITFGHFRLQTLGFSIHLLVNPSPSQSSCVTYVLAKGVSNNASLEYDIKFLLPSNDSVNFPDCYENNSFAHGYQLRAYVYNLTGIPSQNNGVDLGAGVGFDNMPTNHWTDVVVTLDAGDYLQSGATAAAAHLTLYVDGQNAQPTVETSAMYDSFNCTYESSCVQNSDCDQGKACDQGLCHYNGCDPDHWWTIDPLNGGNDLLLGTEEGTHNFHGAIDELAVFPRTLSATDAANLSTWAK